MLYSRMNVLKWASDYGEHSKGAFQCKPVNMCYDMINAVVTKINGKIYLHRQLHLFFEIKFI